MQLTAGQNVPLAGATVTVRLQQPGRAPADIVALLLDDRGRVKGDTDFVFYNAPRHPSGSVTLTEEVLSLDLRLVPAGAERVIVATNSDGDSQLAHLTVLVEGHEMLTFVPSGLAGLPTAVLVEV